MRTGDRRSTKKRGAKLQDERSLKVLLSEHDEKYIPFHMPGHKRNKDFGFLSGVQSLDVTEIDGFDNLYKAEGIIKAAEENAAAYFSVRASRFLVNGATGGILAAIKSLTREGDGILIARNCHQSVYNAVDLCRLSPHYVSPAYFEEYGFYGSVLPEEVSRELKLHEDVKVVVITSPTYEGIISNIKGIATVCHAKGVKLIVDEAHGSHLGLYRKFNQSARTLGADIVVNSLHKTLPSLTQTALLQICSDDVDLAEIDRNLRIFQTSSPSYVFMASIDGCVRFLQSDGIRVFERWCDALDKFRRSMSYNKHIKLLKENSDGRIYALDKTKIVLLTVDGAISGIDLGKRMRDEFNIDLEMVSANYAIAMSAAGDEPSNFYDLAEAVYVIENSVKERYGLVNIDKPIIPEQVHKPCEINALSTDFATFCDSQGMECAESVWAYPPGSPLIFKGETITSDFIHHAFYLYELGVKVESEFGRFPNEIKVVKDSATHEDKK